MESSAGFSLCTAELRETFIERKARQRYTYTLNPGSLGLETCKSSRITGGRPAARSSVTVRRRAFRNRRPRGKRFTIESVYVNDEETVYTVLSETASNFESALPSCSSTTFPSTAVQPSCRTTATKTSRRVFLRPARKL